MKFFKILNQNSTLESLLTTDCKCDRPIRRPQMDQKSTKLNQNSLTKKNKWSKGLSHLLKYRSVIVSQRIFRLSLLLSQGGDHF